MNKSFLKKSFKIPKG